MQLIGLFLIISGQQTEMQNQALGTQEMPYLLLINGILKHDNNPPVVHGNI